MQWQIEFVSSFYHRFCLVGIKHRKLLNMISEIDVLIIINSNCAMFGEYIELSSLLQNVRWTQYIFKVDIHKKCISFFKMFISSKNCFSFEFKATTVPFSLAFFLATYQCMKGKICIIFFVFYFFFGETNERVSQINLIIVFFVIVSYKTTKWINEERKTPKLYRQPTNKTVVEWKISYTKSLSLCVCFFRLLFYYFNDFHWNKQPNQFFICWFFSMNNEHSAFFFLLLTLIYVGI